MQIDPNHHPASTRMRQAPFPATIDQSPDISIRNAVRHTLMRWGNGPDGVIDTYRPSRPRTESTIYAQRDLPHRPGPHYFPTRTYFVHNWTVDPGPFLRALTPHSPYDAEPRKHIIDGAKLLETYRGYDADRDGHLQRAERDRIAADIGELWTYTGNDVMDM